MPSLGKDTGHGATIAFSSGITAFAAPFRKIGAVEQELEKVENTVLSNTASKSYLPGDIAEPGEFEVEYAFNATLDHPDVLTRGTITITAPLATGQASAANLSGTGFIMSRTATPELATNGLQIGKIKCKFDGKTGPTLTVAVDT
jgi:hypothetical protein